jgi:hypothetical protein
MYGTASGEHFSLYDSVKDGLEIIEEDGVGCAFEDEGEAPVRVDSGDRALV